MGTILTIFLIGFGGFFGLIVLALCIGASPKAKRDRAMLVDQQEAKVRSLSSVQGFEPAMVWEGYPGGYGLAIDPASEQVAIAIPGHPPRLYHFSQIVAVEVDRNGQAVTRTEGKIDMKSAAVATALLGPIGMASGAKTSSTSVTTNLVTKLSLKLYVNDLYTPYFEFTFIGSANGITPNEPRLIKAANELDGWYGRFKTILVGLERQGSIDPSKAVQHTAAAPKPEQLQPSWGARVFG